MLFFGKKKKKIEEERKRQEELAKQAKIDEQKKKLEQDRVARETEKIKVETEKVEKELEIVAPEPVVKKTTTMKPSTPVPATAKKAPSGKYELYQEAGMFKFRLKASNGEVLAVSFGYATKTSAKSGIETFKKAVLNGNFEISTDKAGFSHYDLFGSRGARVIMIGEFYKTLKLAESAVESVKKFYETDKVVELKEIPVTEIREEVVPRQKVEGKPNGKYQLVKENAKSFLIKLVASNGQVLLVSQHYTTKQSALSGLEAIKNAIENQNFTIYRDKQNRYQYNLYTNNKQLIVSGETYPVKQNCLSSIQSVLRFAGQAKFVEL